MKIIQSNHLKTLPDAIVCYDKQGKRIYVNSEWEKINQISADSVLNKTTNELPGIIEPDHDKIETIIKSGVSDEWDLKYKDDNGIHQYYSIRATPEYNHLGEINYVLTTARNITKFKLIEEKMNKQISSFFESPLTGMAILLPDKTWNKVNEKLCQILGYGYEEFHNTTWEHFTHPQDIDKDLKQFNKLFQGELFQCKFKKRFIHKNGSIIFADVALRCIRRENNSIDSILVLIEDVTDRVNAKNELQNFNNTLENRIEEKNSHYNSILKNSADIIYLVEVTKKGRFIHKDINEAYLKTTGLSREYLLNRYVDEFDIKEFKDILREKYS
jgi:PAS domain S-box-containing protein